MVGRSVFGPGAVKIILELCGGSSKIFNKEFCAGKVILFASLMTTTIALAENGFRETFPFNSLILAILMEVSSLIKKKSGLFSVLPPKQSVALNKAFSCLFWALPPVIKIDANILLTF